MTQQTEGSEQMEQSLIDIAVESWRFSRLFGKVVSKLDAGESGRYANQLRYFQKKVEESLESSGLKLVNDGVLHVIPHVSQGIQFGCKLLGGHLPAAPAWVSGAVASVVLVFVFVP